MSDRKRSCKGDDVEDNSQCQTELLLETANSTASTHLSRRIPQLQADRPVLEVHCLGQEVDSDGRLVRRVEGIVHEACDE